MTYEPNTRAIEPTAVYSTKQISDLIGLSVDTIQRFVRENRISALKTGAGNRILGEDVLKLFRELDTQSQKQILEDVQNK